MSPKLKKVIAYIFRSWEDEPERAPHPRLKLLPPFFWELLSYLIALALLYRLGAYLWSLI